MYVVTLLLWSNRPKRLQKRLCFLLENCGLLSWKPLSLESLLLSGRTNWGEGCLYTSQRGGSELWRCVLLDKDTVGLRVIIYRRPEAKEPQIKYLKCPFWMARCAPMRWVTRILLRPGQTPGAQTANVYGRRCMEMTGLIRSLVIRFPLVSLRLVFDLPPWLVSVFKWLSWKSFVW